jgi:uncharacterized membrane protein HdeD (DUF308 family)
MAKAPYPGYYGNTYDDPDDDMQHPDPKKHQVISFVKSGVRIVGSLAAIVCLCNPALAVAILAGFYGVAEIIGIYEELV